MFTSIKTVDRSTTLGDAIEGQPWDRNLILIKNLYQSLCQKAYTYLPQLNL